MALHPSDCTCTDTLGCRLRRENAIQVNAGAAKSQLRGRPGNNAQFNGYERGIAYEERPGGYRMPILNEHGSAVRMKEASRRAPEIERMKQRHAADRMKETA